MAVFTDISAPQYRDQLSRVEDAFEIRIIDIQGMLQGTADSKFRVSAAGFEEPLVVTIHETPDVSPAGKTSEQIKIMLHYVDHLADASSAVVDRTGGPVNLKVLKPLTAFPQTSESAPLLELDFDGVTKALSIVPFIVGESYENDPEVMAAPDDARLAGRALGGLSILAQSYPHRAQFNQFRFSTYVKEIDRISRDKGALESLGHFLSGNRLVGKSALDMGRNYIAEMKKSGKELLEIWPKISGRDSITIQPLIHGDFFSDNTMIDGDGNLIVLDFGDTSRGPVGLDIGVALASWASQHGLPDLENVKAFLEAFDSVIPLTNDTLNAIPSFVLIGAYRWETFRIQRIDRQDTGQFDMFSPVEFSSLRHSWQELQEPFASSSSLADLATRI
jgi:Ser/Thr protein kinase RdoA (MazF antagonist)